MKSNVSSNNGNEFHVVGGNEFGESSEDTNGYFETSSSTATLNNEKFYKASTPEQFMATEKTKPTTTTASSRLRSSRMKLQQQQEQAVSLRLCDILSQTHIRFLISLFLLCFCLLSTKQEHVGVSIADPSDMTDSSSQSDDYGNCRSGRRKNSAYSTVLSAARRKKGSLNAKERNLRRLESNERERMRMHSLNDAFQVS